METPIIIGNWKSNKTEQDAYDWVATFSELCTSSAAKIKGTAVLCVPFTLLPLLAELVTEYTLPLVVGAQDVSPFPSGAYTGEISAAMIREYADFVLIGHSERRKYFLETDEMLERKTDHAKDAGLVVVYCVPDAEARIAPGADIVAYEPVWAIGTGVADSIQNVKDVVGTIKKRTRARHVVYGGSVTAENVSEFTKAGIIDGVLPGKASLDPHQFFSILAKAS